MLSICLPIYNFKIETLVSALKTEIKAKKLDVELICVDDFSEIRFRRANEDVCRTLGVEYISLKKNIGRSAIRNLFLELAKGEYLLFLDCDGLPVSEFFLENYINFQIQNDGLIVYGGRIYPSVKPDRKYLLKWNYGKKYESLPVESRILNPNKSFQTNNFMIKRSVFEKYRFNESIRNYGHEDTLFGLDLLKNEIKIEHINNPVLNLDIEEAGVFLYKTEFALHNLLYIVDNQLISDDDFNLIALFRMVKKIPTSLLFLISLLAKPLLFLLKFLFENYILSAPKVFNFYKFLFYISISK